MNTLSCLYEPISQQQLQACCRCYLAEELRHAQLLSGGLFNTTYLLETPTRKAILRLGPVNRHLLLPYEYALMEAEAGIQELLHSHGVPTSRLIALDTGRTLLDRDVMVVAYIPGVSMSTLELPPEQEQQLFREAGRLTRRIHSITADELPNMPEKPFGRYAAVLQGRGGATWKEAVLGEVAQWREKAEPAGLFPTEVFDRLDACYRKFSGLFDAVTVPSLVHGDLWNGNLLVGGNGGLAAIIDADRAIFGDPELELATGWMINDPFLEGYGAAPDPREEAVLRRRLYKLLLNLEDCYILRWEYSDPKASEELGHSILEKLSRLEAI